MTTEVQNLHAKIRLVANKHEIDVEKALKEKRKRHTQIALANRIKKIASTAKLTLQEIEKLNSKLARFHRIHNNFENLMKQHNVFR